MTVYYNDCILFKGEYVSVGIPHNVAPGKLFWYYGTLTEVTDTEIKIQMSHGVKLIPLNQIMELKTKNWEVK
jgi:hypothetical protein